jgi:CarboxypepD_reg-like domain/TonB-dependent Receptor Plug Domain
MRTNLTFFILLLISNLAFSQKQTQSIYGQILDKQTKTPLPGATIILEGSNPKIATTSDENGNFELKNASIGRQVLLISYIGYLPQKSDAIILTSAKSVTVKIELNSGTINTDEVIISANKNAFEPLNELSVVSTRSFSAEETERIPAGVNDPGRVALSYPGVQRGPDDSENQIIVRGNSPIGILWRLEGIDMPNPNHFAVVGSSGGGVSVFSPALLAKSDFSTGGFAAEYGNALSGAFDIQFRHGDMQKRENRAKIGILGLDFATEGPIKAGSSSYLVNYRYSTLGLLGKMGFYLVGERVTNDFQDLSFNLAFKKKKSVSTIFGIGGLSTERYLPVSQGIDRKIGRASEWEDRVKPSNMGAIGYTHTYLPNYKTVIKTVVALVGSDQIRNSDTLDLNNVRFRYNTERYLDKRLVASVSYSKKISDKLWIKTGFIGNQIFYDFFKESKARNNVIDINQRQTNISVKGAGNSQTLQEYVQTSYKLSPKLSINTGIHILTFLANKTGSIEPRFSMQYAPSAASRLSFAYGRHAKILPMMTYFFANKEGKNINLDLKPIKSDHFIAALHHYTQNRMRISLEAYYQNIFNVPISANQAENWWLLNYSADFPEFQVKSKGLGKNKGLDFAIEKQFSNSYFFLATFSALNSKFKANDGIWHNGRFNTLFSSSYTFGKEFPFKNGNILQLGGRFLYNGGFRFTPLDAAKSKAAGKYIGDQTKENEGQVPAYSRLDTRVAYRFNGKKTGGNISLDFQNATNKLNATNVAYDAKTNSTITEYRGSGFIPVLTFQFDF